MTSCTREACGRTKTCSTLQYASRSAVKMTRSDLLDLSSASFGGLVAPLGSGLVETVDATLFPPSSSPSQASQVCTFPTALRQALAYSKEQCLHTHKAACFRLKFTRSLARELLPQLANVVQVVLKALVSGLCTVLLLQLAFAASWRSVLS